LTSAELLVMGEPLIGGRHLPRRYCVYKKEKERPKGKRLSSVFDSKDLRNRGPLKTVKSRPGPILIITRVLSIQQCTGR